MTQFAVKRLAAVEIQPDASNQHELNAGSLRTALGFPHGRTEGSLSILYYPDGDDVVPRVLEGSFTLYDSRARHPKRTEYRLYYRLPGLVELARADDLMVLCRESGTTAIQGVIARSGTQMERQLERSLNVGDHAALRRLLVREQAGLDAPDAGTWVQALLPEVAAPGLAPAARSHRLYATAVERQVVPPTRQMAEAGREIAEVVWGAHLGPDEFITKGLDAESELYFAIEREVGTRSLQALLDAGNANLDEMLAWALRIQQSRKSRRGQSLQNHFAFLLDREGIPYTAQCLTERGETPDFIIPGRTQYHDVGFPAARLRMVACKSTVRERWGQILKEADRIPQKYLLTLDDHLSPEVLRSMRQAQLLAFVPAVVFASYPDLAARELLSNVGQLLAALKCAF